MSTIKHSQISALLVDDDAKLCGLLRDYLEGFGFSLDVAEDASSGLEKAVANEYDVILLDMMLPDMDGLEVLRSVRKWSSLPIVVVSARNHERDKVEALDYGADDYLVKPFSPRELVARVRALLRRVHADSEPQREVLEFGELTIDVSGHKVMVSGKEIDLTASEFKLLTTLSRYPGRVYSRMELVEKVLGYDFEGYERTIDSHVKNLRAKIGDNPRNPKWLHTVHGVGYRFEDPTKANQ